MSKRCAALICIAGMLAVATPASAQDFYKGRTVILAGFLADPLSRGASEASLEG